MNEVYIVEAKRSAIGTFGGSFKGVSAVDIAVPVIQNVMGNANLPASDIDEVILGNVYSAAEKGNPARQATLKAGIAKETSAMTIDKQCASGMRAVTIGALEIASGEADIIVAGGMENMSNVPYLLLNSRWGQRMGDMKAVDGLTYGGLNCAIEGYHMGITAENLVRQYGLTREEQDEFALQSQEKAHKAIEEGKFKDEIVPITVKSKREEVVFDTDEHPRNTSLENLAKLPAAFEKNGTVTAGNSSGLNDGAAVLILASEQAVKKHSLKPIAKMVSWASAAVDPSIMGIGPVPSTKKALNKAKMNINELDLVELNEAFAAQVLAVNKELDIDQSIINVNGGAIALGHPVAGSGARIIVTLIHELQKRQKTLGLASLCVGGGQGVSVIVETL